jgi:small conductance mechanosensitive channel
MGWKSKWLPRQPEFFAPSRPYKSQCLKLTMIRCYINCLFLIVLFAASLAPSSVTSAQAENQDLTKRVTELNSTIVQKLSQAIGGDKSAQQDLIRNYLAPIILTLAVLVTCFIVAGTIGRFVGDQVSKRVDLTLGRFLAKAIRILLMILVGMLVLEYNQISVAGFAAILAAMSFAIGLALQGTLSNFAAGIMLLIFRPFRVNDFIVVAGIEGRVEEIDLFTTRVNTRDNRHIIVPNSEIFGNKLENYDRNPLRRVDVTISTSFSTDIKFVRLVLEQGLNRAAESSEISEGNVELSEIGTHAMIWRVQAWTSPAQLGFTRETLNESLKNALDANGITIGLPQLEIHMAGKLIAKAS